MRFRKFIALCNVNNTFVAMANMFHCYFLTSINMIRESKWGGFDTHGSVNDMIHYTKMKSELSRRDSNQQKFTRLYDLRRWAINNTYTVETVYSNIFPKGISNNTTSQT